MKAPKKILLVIESCNPEWSSVPLVGYNFFTSILPLGDVTLVTHARNEQALKAMHSQDEIVYIRPGKIEHYYYKVIERLTTFKGRVIWPLYHVLSYPLYYFFNRAVAKRFSTQVTNGDFDIVHALTPMMPRYPVEISKYCNNTPFVLGPVNGGVPFPEGFKARGRKEFSQFNFFRSVGRWLIPNYTQTYRNANWVLAGSQYTKGWLESTLKVSNERLSLLFENAVGADFYEKNINVKLEKKQQCSKNDRLNLIFSGRLVPYKGADMLLKAMALPILSAANLHLTIVGDGAERTALEELVNTLSLTEKVSFTGWVNQSATRDYYAQADVFTFPSVREFGGAVVMEAMALGLPCIVVDNGGIGEYVDEACGAKISPIGEEFVIEQLAKNILHYVNDRELLVQHSRTAFDRSRAFSWSAKAKQLNEIYDGLLS